MLAIVLGLCACGGSGEETAQTEPAYQGLQVGYGRESIMPIGQVNISGSGNQEHRVSTGYLDILYATCIAITEGENTILLFSTDTLGANRFGVQSVLVKAIHNHNIWLKLRGVLELPFRAMACKRRIKK